MFRFYDWDCHACGTTHEALLWVAGGGVPSRTADLLCPACGQHGKHTRIVSMPAKLLSDRPLNPLVRGGSYDTMGYQEAPALPDHPLGEAATARDWKDHFHSPEWKNAKAEVTEVNRRNKQKRKRAAALKRGENINMRVDRCVGDPKVAQ